MMQGTPVTMESIFNIHGPTVHHHQLEPESTLFIVNDVLGKPFVLYNFEGDRIFKKENFKLDMSET
jgi:hypothetical protein